ncbi:MAG TPA: transposase [Blastocatellia bacterium]
MLKSQAVKLILQTQLLPDGDQARKLSATMRAFNAAADWLAGEAFRLKNSNKVELQQLYYDQLRADFRISAQMAIRCIAQVCEAYKRDKSIRPRFKKYASIPYDQRLMAFKGVDRVSLLTLEGRTIVPIVMGKYQSERFNGKHGQCDLVKRKDGKWFLLVTVKTPDVAPEPSTDFIGVDFGVVNLAVDSDGEMHRGDDVEQTRQHYGKVKRSLQRKATKQKRAGFRPLNARRKLKALSGRERRFKANTNHTIAKKIVAKATDTGRGIAIEDLEGIRNRIRFRQKQRDRMSKWAFAELRGYIEYKAALSGVKVQPVDPRDTSRRCPECNHVSKKNRIRRDVFLCDECGYFDHADIVGAKNIRSGALVIAREVSAAADGRVSRETSFIYNRGASA